VNAKLQASFVIFAAAAAAAAAADAVRMTIS
jgi:hypothetical protein